MIILRRPSLFQRTFGESTRGVRTRTITKLNIPSKSVKYTKTTEKSTENIAQTRIKDGIKKRFKYSRFNSGGNSTIKDFSINQQIMKEMKFKKPQEIIDELTSKFQKDGIEVDQEFIEKMVEESNNEQKLVSQYINDPTITLEKINEDEINHYIDWIIEDGLNRINNQKSDNYKKKINLRTKLNDFIINENTTNNEDPEKLTNAFVMAQELADLNSESSLDKLPIFLKHINKMNNTELQNSISLEKLSSLYELSTQLIDSRIRETCIYLCGKLLYKALIRELGPRARPDPINEKFYIESCMTFGDLETALSLYESRKDKDVKDERFWYELGVSIYMTKFSTNSEKENETLNIAIDLVYDIRDRWGYVSNLVLIDALKRCCIKGNYEDAFWFWEDIELNINEMGVVPVIEVPETKLFQEKDKEQVFKYYNRTEAMSYKALIECIFSFISSLQFEKGFNILEKVVGIDNEFIYEFVKKFGEQFKYSGRELFLIELENDVERSESKYSNVIRDYLIEEIRPLQTTRCVSIKEAQIIENINVYLHRLTKLKNGKSLSKINDLQEIIQNGEKLTSHDVKNLLNILLQHKSFTSYQLACSIIYQMNEHKANNVLDGILPIANSYTYAEFCNQFLVQSNPRVKEINDFLQMMIDYNIKLDQNLAMRIIMSFVSKKMYTESIKFIESYIFSDNPIAINDITIGTTGNKNLWTTIFMAYYKSVVSGSLSEELFISRLESFHIYMKHLVDENVIHDFTIQEAIGTLLAYGDYQHAIALIEWYGIEKEKINGEKIKFDFVLALKAKFELSISKAEKYLEQTNKSNTQTHQYVDRIKQYRYEFGLQSLQKDLKSRRDFTWQEVAMVLYKYADLFCYKSTYAKEDPFSLLLSDEERHRRKAIFERGLCDVQKLYKVPEWTL